ncbi:lytic polysaccharide monooxygenase [Streptomyces sp. NPDC058548]|uniref:lytic polysaccharide monooxygenase auxiliary activity family 9 protein n=1 Tax=unclassified Streptomyces TaxID=2593676 RepID=UPI00365F955C
MKLGLGAAVATAAGMALSLGAFGPTQQAWAHGAPWNPISRGAACAPDNMRYGDSAACRAAQAAGPGGVLEAWDNTRRKGVDGRHRSFVPDGQLCGAGLDDFRALNLPRTDWPSTIVSAGTDFTFSFLATIPHEGRFTLYITRNGYDPTVPLRWSDLESEPFVEVADPRLIDSTYRFEGRLPAGKAGRHVIFTIWENTTPDDTYYYCSDVVFRTGGSTQAPPSDQPDDAGATPTSVTTSETGAGQGETPLAPLLGGNSVVADPPAVQPTGIVSTSAEARVMTAVAGSLATASVLAVLVLTIVIRRQTRRSS